MVYSTNAFNAKTVPWVEPNPPFFRLSAINLIPFCKAIVLGSLSFNIAIIAKAEFSVAKEIQKEIPLLSIVEKAQLLQIITSSITNSFPGIEKNPNVVQLSPSISSVTSNDLLNSVQKLNLFVNPMGFITKACQPNDDDDDGTADIPRSILPCELMWKHKLGKSLIYTRDLKKGQCLVESDIDVKVSEPNGIPAEFYDDVVGKVLTRDVFYDDPVMECDTVDSI